MNKRVVIIHGRDDSPDGAWLPWLKRELIKMGFDVIVPQMPESKYPQKRRWLETITKEVGEVNEGVVLVGHSLGCRAILFFLQGLESDQKVGQVILVAGRLLPISGQIKDQKLAEVMIGWYQENFGWEKIKTHADKFIAILSDNDPIVDLEPTKKIYQEKLGAKVVVEHHKGHFRTQDGVLELPSVLDAPTNH
ncbi:serine hydrolase family protein [Candidatus Daviesbacteria bacterium]|nr:serine hydrolase family protein [Candidatus Daviesbacteria bacterium]